MDITVSEDPVERRYEAVADGAMVGFTQYRRSRGRIAFVHTEVSEGAAGAGVGTRLVGGALDSAREQGLEVLPFCPFVPGFIERHPEYLDLVPEAHRERFSLSADPVRRGDE